ncbi:oligopeptide transport system substrate-binding protein [Enterococcus sp. PF1-24]|uniref:peptide ABC transporter substrate-binding protein n=1 Tax=unclassified Enterococcus TaxID=2608891 RepID=UPI002475C448|nr:MULTISPECIES: peptide ABC transporter substrate-binding protein [unclassified Enterococcus]MDH6363549.1 oligopeptide transport system substrate-binding protein [Enterococcus sp. PFB1-1]MDH6400784.1 oligopeptide transport system substrate-binding protein [Enterococcus sp. PF1-24]
MKKSVLFGLTATCGLVLSACGGGSDTTTDSGAATGGDTGNLASEQIFRFVESQEMPTADLSLATDVVSHNALNSCYEGLYRVNADQELEPAGAAEMATLSEDGLTYTVKLNEKSVWTNGDPVTADDYVYGWQRTANPETASEYAFFFENLANGKEVVAGEKPVSELGIKAVSDYELEITLAKPTPYFEYLMAFPNFFPQHQATVEEFGDKYASDSDKAIYNGPFTLAEFDGPGIDTEWSYVKNPDYWDAENVKLDAVEVTVVKESSTALNLFEDGQVDDITLSGELAQQMANDPRMVSEMEGSVFYLEYNQRAEDSPLKNVDLRKAVSYCIDRDSFVNNIISNGSLAAYHLIPVDLVFDESGKDFVDQVSTKADFDVDKAKEHWAKAKKDLGVETLEVEILADDSERGKKIAEYLQGALEENLEGMKVKVSTVPFAVRLDRSNNGDFDIVMTGWGADYADPSSFLDLFATDGSYNRGKWTNAEYDALLEKMAVTDALDADKRWEDMIEASDIIMDEAAIAPVYQKAEAHMRAENVKGMVHHASGVKRDFKWIYIEE